MHAPPLLLQQSEVSLVAFHVTLEFRHPVFEILFRRRRVALWAPVPEAAIDEQAHFLARPCHIGATGGFPLQAIATKPRFTQTLAHKQLGLGIFAFVALHARVGGGAHVRAFFRKRRKHAARLAATLARKRAVVARHRHVPQALAARLLYAMRTHGKARGDAFRLSPRARRARTGAEPACALAHDLRRRVQRSALSGARDRLFAACSRCLFVVVDH